MDAFTGQHAAALAGRLAHVRWIAGGTGSGKSTLARFLAERYDVNVYVGDRAERQYVQRCSPEQQPYLSALLRMPPEQRWSGRTAEAVFAAMPSLHGETFGFVVEDLLALPDDRPLLADDFRTLPAEVAALLSWREQAVFLLPAAEFRHRVLSDRFADPRRAHANWGNTDHSKALTLRLARDQLWDAEVRRQAAEAGLVTITVDGEQNIQDLGQRLARMFLLDQ